MLYVQYDHIIIIEKVHILYLCTCTNIQEPQERVLGYEYQGTSHGTSLVNEYCYDVPLLESLQSLLKCDSIVEQVH